MSSNQSRFAYSGRSSQIDNIVPGYNNTSNGGPVLADRTKIGETPNLSRVIENSSSHLSAVDQQTEASLRRLNEVIQSIEKNPSASAPHPRLSQLSSPNPAAPSIGIAQPSYISALRDSSSSSCPPLFPQWSESDARICRILLYLKNYFGTYDDEVRSNVLSLSATHLSQLLQCFYKDSCRLITEILAHTTQIDIDPDKKGAVGHSMVQWASPVRTVSQYYTEIANSIYPTSRDIMALPSGSEYYPADAYSDSDRRNDNLTHNHHLNTILSYLKNYYAADPSSEEKNSIVALCSLDDTATKRDTLSPGAFDDLAGLIECFYQDCIRLLKRAHQWKRDNTYSGAELLPGEEQIRASFLEQSVPQLELPCEMNIGSSNSVLRTPMHRESAPISPQPPLPPPPPPESLPTPQRTAPTLPASFPESNDASRIMSRLSPPRVIERSSNTITRPVPPRPLDAEIKHLVRSPPRSVPPVRRPRDDSSLPPLMRFTSVESAQPPEAAERFLKSPGLYMYKFSPCVFWTNKNYQLRYFYVKDFIYRPSSTIVFDVVTALKKKYRTGDMGIDNMYAPHLSESEKLGVAQRDKLIAKRYYTMCKILCGIENVIDDGAQSGKGIVVSTSDMEDATQRERLLDALTNGVPLPYLCYNYNTSDAQVVRPRYSKCLLTLLSVTPASSIPAGVRARAEMSKVTHSSQCVPETQVIAPALAEMDKAQSTPGSYSFGNKARNLDEIEAAAPEESKSPRNNALSPSHSVRPGSVFTVEQQPSELACSCCCGGCDANKCFNCRPCLECFSPCCDALSVCICCRCNANRDRCSCPPCQSCCACYCCYPSDPCCGIYCCNPSDPCCPPRGCRSCKQCCTTMLCCDCGVHCCGRCNCSRLCCGTGCCARQSSCCCSERPCCGQCTPCKCCTCKEPCCESCFSCCSDPDEPCCPPGLCKLCSSVSHHRFYLGYNNDIATITSPYNIDIYTQQYAPCADSEFLLKFADGSKLNIAAPMIMSRKQQSPSACSCCRNSIKISRVNQFTEGYDSLAEDSWNLWARGLDGVAKKNKELDAV